MYVDNDICYHGKAFYMASKQHAIVMHEYYMYTTCIANIANDSWVHTFQLLPSFM